MQRPTVATSGASGRSIGALVFAHGSSRATGVLLDTDVRERAFVRFLCQSTTVSVVPANLSPEYKAAEAAFRKTRDPRERLEWLREMLRAIPKHKGSEHFQADIKARSKDLGVELEGPGRGGGHGGPPW
jgi:hypothetical protein